jgi:hypothetical protein
MKNIESINERKTTTTNDFRILPMTNFANIEKLKT